ncbi:unnamed protein product [Victoria cruziana]
MGRLRSLVKLVMGFLMMMVVVVMMIGRVEGHNDAGEGGHCDSNPEYRIQAEYKAGGMNVDGHADDWNDVDGFSFPLLPALDPDEDKQYPGGSVKVKAVHNGRDVFFMLQVDGDYAYEKGNQKQCPSVALMFQVGENATYHNMGGCEDMPGTCTSKTCRGHEVDIMHFSIGTAVPGRLYGGNHLDNGEGSGGDRFGHLVDLYAWNPHCRYLDGKAPAGSLSGNDSSAQNDWKGAWWHDSFTTHSGFVEEDSPYSANGKKGTYYFEFSRPLRTMDHFQQDAQFTMGQTSKFAIAFWYPVDGKPWSGVQHYSANCDWIPLDITRPSTSSSTSLSSGHSEDALSIFTMLLSVAAFCVSVFIAYWIKRSKAIPFTPIDHL